MSPRENLDLLVASGAIRRFSQRRTSRRRFIVLGLATGAIAGTAAYLAIPVPNPATEGSSVEPVVPPYFGKGIEFKSGKPYFTETPKVTRVGFSPEVGFSTAGDPQISVYSIPLEDPKKLIPKKRSEIKSTLAVRVAGSLYDKGQRPDGTNIGNLTITYKGKEEKVGEWILLTDTNGQPVTEEGLLASSRADYRYVPGKFVDIK